MWTEFNNNPVGRSVGDCAVRAVSAALDTDWETAYVMMCINGFLMGDMPSADAVWGAVLRQNGFYKSAIPDECPDCYTAEMFCGDHPEGTFVLCFGGHAATVKDGALFDSWDSSEEIPVYYWHRKDGL